MAGPPSHPPSVWVVPPWQKAKPPASPHSPVSQPSWAQAHSWGADCSDSLIYGGKITKSENGRGDDKKVGALWNQTWGLYEISVLIRKPSNLKDSYYKDDFHKPGAQIWGTYRFCFLSLASHKPFLKLSDSVTFFRKKTTNAGIISSSCTYPPLLVEQHDLGKCFLYCLASHNCNVLIQNGEGQSLFFS